MKFCILLLALILISAGCVRYVQVPAQPAPQVIPAQKVEPAYTAPKGWLAIENKYSFVAVPDGWKEEASEDEDDDRPHRNFLDRKRSIMFVIGYEDDDQGLKKYIQNVLSNLAKDEDAKFINGRKIQIDGQPAAQMILRKENTAVLSHIVVKGEQVFQLNCYTNVDNFETMADACAAIVETFRFKK